MGVNAQVGLYNHFASALTAAAQASLATDQRSNDGIVPDFLIDGPPSELAELKSAACCKAPPVCATAASTNALLLLSSTAACHRGTSIVRCRTSSYTAAIFFKK